VLPLGKHTIEYFGESEMKISIFDILSKNAALAIRLLKLLLAVGGILKNIIKRF